MNLVTVEQLLSKTPGINSVTFLPQQFEALKRKELNLVELRLSIEKEKR